ncbi:MAG: SHOCT domain-containing protein [Firmicutes bacterium]|nr:SHOCT domain-containing protein [Bacillota bacterium]
MGFGWARMVFMGLCLAVFLGGLLVLGAFLLRWVLMSANQRGSAEETLKLRLAKGEITREQYEELKGLIRQ